MNGRPQPEPPPTLLDRLVLLILLGPFIGAYLGAVAWWGVTVFDYLR